MAYSAKTKLPAAINLGSVRQVSISFWCPGIPGGRPISSVGDSGARTQRHLGMEPRIAPPLKRCGNYGARKINARCKYGNPQISTSLPANDTHRETLGRAELITFSPRFLRSGTYPSLGSIEVPNPQLNKTESKGTLSAEADWSRRAKSS